MRFAIAAAAVTLLLGSVSAARAQEDFGRPGPYVGLGLTVLVEDFDGSPGASDDAGTGFMGRVGYRLFPHLAFEIEGEYLGRAGKVDDIWAVNGVFKVPILTGRIQPFAQAAMGVLGSKSQNTGFAGGVGAGLDLCINENLTFSSGFTYVWPTSQVRNLEHYSIDLGLQWRF